jgi:hypothetical protein
MCRMRARRCAFALLMMLALSAGCRTFNKHITEAVLDGGQAKQWQVHYGSAQQYQLDNSRLEQIEFEGTVTGPRISVRYQRRLGDQAQQIANRATEMLKQVETRIGATITTNSTIHLFRFDQTPQNYNIRLTVEPNEFPWLLFVRAGDESYPAILAQNPSYPYLFVHELVETSLVSSGADARLLPDIGWGALGLTVHVNNYTRWFRDGLANYAGYVAHGVVAKELARSESAPPNESLLHTRPFSALARVRHKLFSWPQSAQKEQQREYYNAALGLFLLIEHRFGEQAIRDIMLEIATRDAVDRHDLLEITNAAIGTDVKKLVAGFRFPATGLRLVRNTPALALNNGLDVEEGLFVDAVRPGSLGDRAGLQAKDVIITAETAALTSELDLELALFRAREKQSIPLTVRRHSEGTVALKMPLPATSGAAVSRGKRRNPLKKGRIDVIGSFPFLH